VGRTLPNLHQAASNEQRCQNPRRSGAKGGGEDGFISHRASAKVHSWYVEKWDCGAGQPKTAPVKLINYEGGRRPFRLRL
jgi:hypothetical protein